MEPLSAAAAFRSPQPIRPRTGLATAFAVSVFILAVGGARGQAFTDDFNRPDSPVVGNGWSDSVSNLNGNLSIRSGQLTAAEVTRGGPASRPAGTIHRFFPLGGGTRFTFTLHESSGYGGLPRQHDAEIGVLSSGSYPSGYRIQIARSDINYSDSMVELLDGSVRLARQPMAIQFGATITVSATFCPDGSVDGTISQGAVSESFAFPPRAVASVGSDVLVSLAPPDGRAAVNPLYHRLDDLVIEAVNCPGSNRTPTCSIVDASPLGDCASFALRAAAADEDSDPLTATWTADCSGATFVPGPDVLDPILVLEDACDRACNVTFRVDDGRGGACEARAGVRAVDDTSPELRGIPPDLRVSCLRDVPGPAAVSAYDACDSAPALSFSERLEGLPPCSFRIVRTWSATDRCGNVAMARQVISVVDDEGPEFASTPRFAAGKDVIWPPRHGYVDHALDDILMDVEDACGGPVIVLLATCASSQPEDSIGMGDGRSDRDCVIAADRQSASFRAERDGACAPLGRTYRLTLVAQDECGNQTLSSPATLCVPHDGSGLTDGFVSPPPGSTQTDRRPGLNGEYGDGCGGGCEGS